MKAAKRFAPLFVILSFAVANAYGQDRTTVTFSEESDTSLVKQRFIDQYEAVFMTRVPTRHMFHYGSAIDPLKSVFFRTDRIGVFAAEAGYGSWSWNTLDVNTITKAGQGTFRMGLGWAI